jgi:hypothetical protein
LGLGSFSGSGSGSGQGKQERIWKWREPPTSPLKRTSESKKAKWEAATNPSRAGSQQTTIRRVTLDGWKGETDNGDGGGGEFGEKPLPVLPPPTPDSDSFGFGTKTRRRSKDGNGNGQVNGNNEVDGEMERERERDDEDRGPITTPPPKIGEEDDKLGETTVTLLSTSRTGFPHRPKLKSDQSNLPEGLWKGQLNYQWWMIPTLDWAGLSVKVSERGPTWRNPVDSTLFQFWFFFFSFLFLGIIYLTLNLFFKSSLVSYGSVCRD